MATRQTQTSKQTRFASKSPSASAAQTLLPWLGIAIIVILIDQLSKVAVMRSFGYGEGRAVTSFFNLVLVYNPGAAFSFLAAAGGWQRWVFTVLGVIAAIVICYLLKRHHAQKMFATSLSLIMGGAIGNVVDRMVHGHVIDFLDFHVARWHWPAFNMADSAICVGAVLLVIDELRRVRTSR